VLSEQSSILERIKMKNTKGFTLIEMMTVVSIVGILCAIAIPSLLSLYKPLKNAAAIVSGKINLMKRLGKTDPSRFYCIRADAATYGFSPNSVITKFVGYSTIDGISKRSEPTLNFDLPQGVRLSNYHFRFGWLSLSGLYYPHIDICNGFTAYDNYEGVQSYITNHQDPPAFAGKSTGGTVYLNSPFIISVVEGADATEAGILVNATGQSLIVYRKANNYNSSARTYTSLPNY
jgi:prepilin-type N-terminal cleavage/methylation domain-containing protein